MSAFEFVLYVVFTVGIFLIAIGIFFYNTRHEDKFVEKKIKKIKHENKKDKVVEFKKNQNFDWDIYEDDLTFDDKRFLGFDIWEFQETAITRIKKLKIDFEQNDSLYFNLIEILMLIDKYGEFITINENGEFVIGRMYLSNFIKQLSYDIELINLLHEIKLEYLSTTKDIEIDAREIFFIMKNAKNFGLGNVENHVQFFQFVNKNKSGIIIEEKSLNSDRGTNNIKIIISDKGVSESQKNIKKDSFTKKDITPKEELQNVVDMYSSDLKKEMLENGFTKLTYSDGTVVIKNGLWEIIDVKTLEDIKLEEEALKERMQKENHKKAVGIANEVVASLESEGSKKNIKEAKREALISDYKNDINLQGMPTKNMSDNFIDSKYFVPLKRTDFYFYNNGTEKSFYNYFTKVFSEDGFDKAIRTLSSENLFQLLGIFFQDDFNRIVLNYHTKEKVNLPLIFKDERNYYLSYELVIYILLNLIKEKDVLLERTITNISGFSMRYPSPFIDSFSSHYRDVFHSDIFLYEKEINHFFKYFLFDGKYYKANFLIFNQKFIEHIRIQNEALTEQINKIFILNKDDVDNLLKNGEVFYQITLRNFKKDFDE